MTELSGILCSLWLIPLVGLLGGFLAGLIGVGGGILITPILITLGLPARIIAGTMPMVIITNSLSTLRQLRPRELLDFRLGGLLGLSGAIGGFLGAMLVHYLETTADVDRIIQVMFVILLLLAMLRLLFASDQTGNINKLSFLVRLPLLQFYTPLAGRRISLLPLLLLGLLIGAVAGMMGVGGAILLTPALILLLGLDIKQASALAVIYILITALFNAVSHALITENSNLLLGLLLMPSGALGAIFGVRIRQWLPLRKMNRLFALVLFGAALNMAWKTWYSNPVTVPVVTETAGAYLSPTVTALLSLLFPVAISFGVFHINKYISRRWGRS